MTPDRLARLQQVVERRMGGLHVVLEGLYDPGNQSSVFRTAEALGLLHVGLIHPERARKLWSRAVSRGAEKWLRITRWQSPTEAVAALRAQGCRIWVSDLRAAAPLTAIDFREPVALVFGNEHHGITDEMRAMADGAFVIPMDGLSESLNIGVAAGVALRHARQERERALGRTGDLSVADKTELLEAYVRQAARWASKRRRDALPPSLQDRPSAQGAADEDDEGPDAD